MGKVYLFTDSARGQNHMVALLLTHQLRARSPDVRCAVSQSVSRVFPKAALYFRCSQSRARTISDRRSDCGRISAQIEGGLSKKGDERNRFGGKRKKRRIGWKRERKLMTLYEEADQNGKENLNQSRKTTKATFWAPQVTLSQHWITSYF